MNRHVRRSRVWAGGFLIAVLCGASVAGQQLPPTTLAATSNIAVLQATGFVDRLIRAGNLEVLRVDTDPLLPGRTYERLAQSYDGVPVYGTDITRQMDGGRTRSVFGVVYEDIDLETTPTVSVEIAQAVIEGLARASMNPGTQPELTILPLDAGGYALTYYWARVHGYRLAGVLHRRPYRQPGAGIQRSVHADDRGHRHRRSRRSEED